MLFRIRHVLFLLLLAGGGFLGSRIYRYFFDTLEPRIMVKGLTEGEWYAGDIACVLQSSKRGELSLWLDEHPLVTKCKVTDRPEGYPFTIPTRTVANGEHRLRMVVADTTFHKNYTELERSFQIDNRPLQLALLKKEDTYQVLQGRTIHVQFQVNKEIQEASIKVLSQKYACFPEAKDSLVYEAFIPIACEELPNEYLFSVEAKDSVGNRVAVEQPFQIVAYAFPRQSLKISDEKIQEEAELGKDSKQFAQIIADLSAASPCLKLWKGQFTPPIEIERVTTEFGTIRTTQHKGRYAHKAIDIINAPKSVVWATQSGVVVLKERFAFSGNTVVIDHGMGVLSLFFHLDTFADIEVGDTIAQGEPIGTIGKTGYANGYHLHWEMRVANIPVDPMQWTQLVS